MGKKNNKKIITINLKTSSLISLKPSQFKDSKIIVKELVKGNVLVLDLQFIDSLEAIRLIDFVTGALVAIGGGFKKIASKTYLIAPDKALLEKFLNQI